MDKFARVLRGGFVLLVIGTAVTILLILAGVFDPKPMGELVVERPLFPQIIAPQAPRITWLQEALPAGNYSVRLKAAQEAGSTGHGMDIGYGLVLGNDENHVAAAVSPLGYLSVWQETSQGTNVIIPWQPWPHVRRDTALNEIWLAVEENGRLSVRINRERLWEGEIEPLTGQIGVIGQSLAETAVVDYKTLQVYQINDPQTSAD